MISEKYIHAFKDEKRIREWVEAVLNDGYVLLPDFLEPTFIAEVEVFARKVTLGDVMSSKSDDTTPMMRLARSEEFMSFFDTVYRVRCEILGDEYTPLDATWQRVGLPYKDATGGLSTKQTEFHYDGAYVNATIGIIEPPVGQGELHLFPNFRAKFAHPLLGKVIARLLRHSRILRSLYGYVRVPSRRNTLCLFFGDRSFHGVEPITSGKRMIITINSHW